ncbi:MAG: tetratricopeptide repeat protein [Bacteriovoracaceae bacterium]
MLTKDSLETLFVKSNEAYNKGDYSEAIAGYEQIISQHNDLPDLYFNLGNAYLKSQNSGKAIFYYKKASSLSPRDPDIRYNLKYAKEKTIDKVEPLSTMQDYMPPFTSGEFLIFLAFFSIVLWGSAIIVLYKKIEIVKWIRNSFALLSFLTLIPLSISYFKSREFGVITVPETNVYSAIGKDNVVLFTLHEGTDFTILNKIDQWRMIELADGKKGWIAKDKIIE